MPITKEAMITLCGRPNVGKSSLTNALVGEKIAIVSNKPQTTRTRIRGVVNTGDTQLVLMDTPGLHKAQNRLGDYMVKVVENSLSDIDVVVMLVEPIAHVGKPEEILIERLKRSGEKAILVINKIVCTCGDFSFLFGVSVYTFCRILPYMCFFQGNCAAMNSF